MTALVDSFNCGQKRPPPEIESMKFYPADKNWSRKIRAHLENPVLQKVLVSDFNKYTTGRWGRDLDVEITQATSKVVIGDCLFVAGRQGIFSM